MKVILLAPTPPPAGGIATWAVRMQDAAKGGDWKIDIVDEKVIGRRTTFGEGSKSRLSEEACRSMKIWRDLARALKDRDAKIVQACIPATCGAMLREIGSAVITRLRGRKFITHFHCTVPNLVKSRLSRLMCRMLVGLSHGIFVLNGPALRFIEEMAPGKRCAVIPNFVNESELADNRSYSEALKRIIYVGGVVPEKGCDRMIEAARLFPEIEFRMVGKPGLDTSAAPENVVFAGEMPHDRVRRELMDADVFMFLSRFPGEGFSISLTEAMAAGLPCIVTDWAANADMIEHEKGGIVVENDDSEAVGRAIEALRSGEIRRRMGNWNRDKVHNCYLEARIMEMFKGEWQKYL